MSAVGGAPARRLLGPLVEVGPVGQAGQHVVERLVGEERFGLLLLLAGGSGHPDDDGQHAGAEGADGLGLAATEERGHQPDPDEVLGHGDVEQRPAHAPGATAGAPHSSSSSRATKA